MGRAQNWWGDFQLENGQTRRWQIGPTTLWVTRTHNEWRVANQQGEDPLDSRLAVAEPCDEEPSELAEIKRFAVGGESSALRLVPALADRPVITKTEQPLYLPPGEEATLYIGSPLWLRVYVGSKLTELVDFPIFRPSDTWFGPDTLSGELCYASRTTARLNLDNLPLRPHRAISAARIRNNAKSKLHLEKLKLPVQNLSLFVSEQGHLWTEALTLVREDDSDAASVRLDKQTAGTVAARLVAPARVKVSAGFLLDAFGGLFGRKVGKDDERVSKQPGRVSDTDT